MVQAHENGASADGEAIEDVKRKMTAVGQRTRVRSEYDGTSTKSGKGVQKW